MQKIFFFSEAAMWLQLDLCGICFLYEHLQSGEQSFESVVIAGDSKSQDLSSMLFDIVVGMKW